VRTGVAAVLRRPLVGRTVAAGLAATWGHELFSVRLAFGDEASPTLSATRRRSHGYRRANCIAPAWNDRASSQPSSLRFAPSVVQASSDDTDRNSISSSSAAMNPVCAAAVQAARLGVKRIGSSTTSSGSWTVQRGGRRRGDEWTTYRDKRVNFPAQRPV